jgi:hypothetical protein
VDDLDCHRDCGIVGDGWIDDAGLGLGLAAIGPSSGGGGAVGWGRLRVWSAAGWGVLVMASERVEAVGWRHAAVSGGLAGEPRSHCLLDVPDQGEDEVGAIRGEQFLSERSSAKQSADACQDLEVLGHAGGHEEEEELNWAAVDGAVRDSFWVSAEHNHGVADETAEGGSGMRQSHAVADTGAVEILAFAQGGEEGGALLGKVAEFGDDGDQLGQD